MKLIFIYGLPATGKLTVAQELLAITGYKLFHNHLVVDLLLSVFEFGSPEFVTLREEFWLSIIDQACRSELPGMIFTFAPERTVRPQFIAEVQRVIRENGGRIDFIELVCPIEELKARMDRPSRLQYRKLSLVALFEELHGDGVFDSSHMPEPRLRIDTSLHTPAEAAAIIEGALG